MFYSVDETEELNLKSDLTDSPDELLQRGKAGSPDIQDFLHWRLGIWNIKKLLLIKENQIASRI